MSNIILPFLFKCNILRSHHIIRLLPILHKGKFITTSRTGELVIWNNVPQNQKNNFVPSIFLVPCLNQNVGVITAMAIMAMPEPELMVCVL